MTLVQRLVSNRHGEEDLSPSRLQPPRPLSRRTPGCAT